MTPRFSVLLPTHNRADILRYAVQSVLWQTEQDFEILIVGDGCTDNTAETVGSFTDPRIRWFDLPKAPNFGYANRNIVLKQARGEYVAYLTDDNILFDDHLEFLGAALRHSQADWAYSQPLWVDVRGTAVVYPMNLHNPTELDVFLTSRNSIPSTCVAHRRRCLDEYGYWPEEIPTAGDWVLWKRIVEGGGRSNFTYCREPTCLHFVADWRSDTSPLYNEDCWPVAASLHIPADCSAQEAFFNAISANGREWIARLRAQGRRAIDRFAWRAMRELIPQLAELESREKASRRAAEVATRRLEKVESESDSLLSHLENTEMECLRQMEAVYQSYSWRLTAPLRALGRLVLGD